MTRLATLLAVLLLALAAPALAQDQTTMNRQAEDAWKKADAELNAVYRKLSQKLDPASRKKLVTAEQLWIKFRDADTAARIEINAGGSIQPLIQFTWMEKLTRARTKQLRAWLEELEES